MTAPQIDPREFGQLEAEVAALRGVVQQQGDLIKRQGELMQTLVTELAAVRLTLAEARGGWRTLLVIGGAVAGLPALVTWLVQHFKG